MDNSLKMEMKGNLEYYCDGDDDIKYLSLGIFGRVTNDEWLFSGNFSVLSLL